MTTATRTPKDASRFLMQAASILSGQQVVAPKNPLNNKDRFLLRVGLASITLWASGQTAIAGPATDADGLCQLLSNANLLHGWQPGSRGVGVTWAPALDVEAVAAWILRLCKSSIRASDAEDNLVRAVYFSVSSSDACKALAQRLVDGGLARLDATEAIRLLGYDLKPQGGHVATTSDVGWLGLELVGTRLRLTIGTTTASPGDVLATLQAGIDLEPCHVDGFRNMFAPTQGG